MDNMANVTKKERRQAQLDRHYKALEELAIHLGVDNPNGKKLSCALLRLEQEAHRLAEAYCNGKDIMGKPYDSDDWENDEISITLRVQKLFNGVTIPGFFVN